MSGSVLTLLRSPDQASVLSSHAYRFPKQRHNFIVRFNLGGGVSLGTANVRSLSYAVKAVDRPSVQPKTEELSEYGKKRIIHTGVKMASMKMSFYDTGDTSANSMWLAYSRHYFGDFATGNDTAYHYDATNPEFIDHGSAFGFTAKNGGGATSDSMFFFSSIDVIHLHNSVYDMYRYVNPRIVAWDADDLDLEQSAISTINAQFDYETVIVTPNYSYAKSLPEFASGQPLNGNPLAIPDVLATGVQPILYSEEASTDDAFTADSLTGGGVTVNGVDNGLGFISAILRTGVAGNTAGEVGTGLSAFRYLSRATSGGLGVYGNYAFGSTPSQAASSSGLSSAVLGNPYLLSALGLGQQTASAVAIAGQYLAQNQASLSVRRGLTLQASAYSALNATGNGTAQYGYNTSTLPNGTSYGYTGSSGYAGPFSGASTDFGASGGDTVSLPSGLDGRYGITPTASDTIPSSGGLY